MVTTHSSRATYRVWLTYNMKVKVRNTRQYTIVLFSAIFMRGKCPQSYQICTIVTQAIIYIWDYSYPLATILLLQPTPYTGMVWII